MGKAGKTIVMHLLFGECTKAEPTNAGCARKKRVCTRDHPQG